MALNVELLRSSFALVVEREPEVTHKFYDVLFSRYPEAKPLFSHRSRQEQERMLRDMLVSIVDHLEDGAWLTSQLRALGSKHQGYGVKPEMYGWVGESLLETLASVAGPEWTPELAAAWKDAYGAVAGLMQAAPAA
ncbi:MAG TPA: globin domain-containing protein [Polyangiaceae bacterium]|jgi:hemoglobin-like flavoprotein|nr:globin domain-containing protein [Polyangiaceae bacterium]